MFSCLLSGRSIAHVVGRFFCSPDGLLVLAKQSLNSRSAYYSLTLSLIALLFRIVLNKVLDWLAVR